MMLDEFNEKGVLAEVDGLLYHCKVNEAAMETINDINVKTLNYQIVQKAEAISELDYDQEISRGKHNLIAVPLNKGIGICVMKKEDYNNKLDTIL